MDTNIVEQSTRTITEINPHAITYTFKEWAGVVGVIATTIYTGGHVVYMFVVSHGGLSKIWSDFLGPKISPVSDPAKMEKTNELAAGGSSAALPTA